MNLPLNLDFNSRRRALTSSLLLMSFLRESLLRLRCAVNLTTAEYSSGTQLGACGHRPPSRARYQGRWTPSAPYYRQLKLAAAEHSCQKFSRVVALKAVMDVVRAHYIHTGKVSPAYRHRVTSQNQNSTGWVPSSRNALFTKRVQRTLMASRPQRRPPMFARPLTACP